VTVPDLTGCFSSGSNIEQAIDNAQEAILCHVEGILIDNELYQLPAVYSITRPMLIMLMAFPEHWSTSI
jgi:predicted RNase H-like HicB family nuclease